MHLDVKLDNIMLKLAPVEAGGGPQGRERAILRDPESGRLEVKASGGGLRACNIVHTHACPTNAPHRFESNP